MQVGSSAWNCVRVSSLHAAVLRGALHDPTNRRAIGRTHLLQVQASYEHEERDRVPDVEEQEHLKRQAGVHVRPCERHCGDPGELGRRAIRQSGPVATSARRGFERRRHEPRSRRSMPQHRCGFQSPAQSVAQQAVNNAHGRTVAVAEHWFVCGPASAACTQEQVHPRTQV